MQFRLVNKRNVVVLSLIHLICKSIYVFIAKAWIYFCFVLVLVFEYVSVFRIAYSQIRIYVRMLLSLFAKGSQTETANGHIGKIRQIKYVFIINNCEEAKRHRAET